MKRPYEGIIFMKPSLSEAELGAVLNKIKNIITEMKGVVTEEKAPEKKKLPYIMRKQREAFYYFIKFDIESMSVEELRGRVKILEEIIKLTFATAVPQKAPPPAAPKPDKPAGEVTVTESGGPEAAPDEEEKKV
jgi:small subunit ribosomal protein S6